MSCHWLACCTSSIDRRSRYELTQIFSLLRTGTMFGWLNVWMFEIARQFFLLFNSPQLRVLLPMFHKLQDNTFLSQRSVNHLRLKIIEKWAYWK
jgi:hypothetical protein